VTFDARIGGNQVIMMNKISRGIWAGAAAGAAGTTALNAPHLAYGLVTASCTQALAPS